MVADGYACVRCVDNCGAVVKQMSAKYAGVKGLSYGVEDATALSGVRDGTVDLVVGKGLLDTILCGEDSGDLAAQMVAAAHRVLKKRGVLLVVTHAPFADKRAALLSTGDWKVATHTLLAPKVDDGEEDVTHYVFACTKQ